MAMQTLASGTKRLVGTICVVKGASAYYMLRFYVHLTSPVSGLICVITKLFKEDVISFEKT